ncbi:hypothetical protein RO3G_04989 [Rhizopus delemar RA 99-880]|uniref:Uncharacterized protein n=1 Tax=Rhizopus delemar (strain RA 99-880 / ATCC MYA-4621 / FGSC 9543 / NRRL 43880) TaxID=246409 RepID=I1BVQ4_RHIO9|nr:hypothetical protein RO3G_04989 [Rhizopus delemar RA 99-880]|eukprot:EIE80284.1 hypothetical protein RO3G_04989 [Rhizopus delemar RA 99-880]
MKKSLPNRSFLSFNYHAQLRQLLQWEHGDSDFVGLSLIGNLHRKCKGEKIKQVFMDIIMIFEDIIL